MPKRVTPRDPVAMRRMGRRIREAREAMGASRREMAEQIGFSYGWLAEVEAGKLAVDALALYRIARHLGYPVEYFVAPTFRFDVRAPKNAFEWKQMYPDEPERAAAHAKLDQVFDMAAAQD